MLRAATSRTACSGGKCSITEPSSDYGRWGSVRSAAMSRSPVGSRTHAGQSPRTESPHIVISSPSLQASVPRRWSGACRVVMAVALFGAVIAAIILGSSRRADASSCSGPLAGGEIRVVIVVDGADLGSGSSATCLVVPAGTTGSQLLARRSAELGTGPLRYGSSGLLCAIDGLPGTGCGDRNADGFAYWAYFSGSSGTWIYGNANPFIKRLSDGDIEGWRYVRGAGNGQDPPPRISPSVSLFPALVSALPPAPESPPASPVVGGGAGGSSGAVNSAVDEVVPESEPDSSASGSSVANTVRSEAEPIGVETVALASSAASRSTTGRWIGIVAVAVLIVVMAGGAWVQTRRAR